MLDFGKIKLKNFRSYKEAELNLRDRGFCLISAENHCKTDNAGSNGSGKSSIVEAICFALTGETTNEVSKGLVNNQAGKDEDAYVELELNKDRDNYIIKRILAPKSDMRITKNGQDISGKGIRESQAILEKELPDVDHDLIASTIVLGQSMPYKFSSFAPSGRKELLEKLTKSDFMIEDMKKRVAERLDELNKKLREDEDSLLLNNSKLSQVKNELRQLEYTRDNSVSIDYNAEIARNEKFLNETTATINKTEKENTKLQIDIDSVNKKLAELNNKRLRVREEELNSYNKSINEYVIKASEIKSNINSLNREIIQLKNIRDICPTCGQKIPGIHKHDTSKQEAEVKTLQESLKTVQDKSTEINKKHDDYIIQIDSSFKDDINKLNSELETLTGNQSKNNRELRESYSRKSALEAEISKFKYEQSAEQKNWNSLIKDIEEHKKAITQLENLIRLAEDGKVTYESRLEVVKKMDILIKRDFRGYLLINIIEYLNKKAKEYCNIVFGNELVNLELSGNNLEITYAGKTFDNLSGGEKQRVDIMLQFALRDLMNKYFNVDSNIIVLDEITDYLDKQACQAVIKLITEKLNDTESVFIISHHMSELGLPIDSEVHVVKDENGISSIR